MMIRIISAAFIFFSILGCKSLKDKPNDPTNPTVEYQQQQENMEQDIYFRAVGNEPEWSLKISGKMIMFASLKPGFESLDAPVVNPERAMDANARMYTLTTASGKMNVEIRQQSCTNSMSGAISPYVVTVNISRQGDTGFTTFNGCGYYITDYRLHDIWVLEEINGEKVNPADFNKELPNIEINSTTNTFMGFAGCNQINGTIFFENGLLRFTNIASTRMFCGDNNKENKFLKALQGATGYKVENNRLILTNPSGLEMVLKKVD